MKVLAVIVVGLVACLGLAGGAVIAGFIRVPSAVTQTTVQAIPPLQPVAQSSNIPDLTITLSEAYMSRKITEGMPSTGEVTNPQIDILPNSMAIVTANVKTGFLNVTPKATVQMAVQNGRVVINVIKVDVGGFGVPSSLIEPQIAELKQNAEKTLNDQLVVNQTNMGLKLQSTSTTDNSLSLSFVQ